MDFDKAKLIEWVLLTDLDALETGVTLSFPMQTVITGDQAALTSMVTAISQLTSDEDGDLTGVYVLALTKPGLVTELAATLDLQAENFGRTLILLTNAADAIDDLTKLVSRYVYNDPQALRSRVIYTGGYREFVEMTGEEIVRKYIITGQRLA